MHTKYSYYACRSLNGQCKLFFLASLGLGPVVACWWGFYCYPSELWAEKIPFMLPFACLIVTGACLFVAVIAACIQGEHLSSTSGDAEYEEYVKNYKKRKEERKQVWLKRKIYICKLFAHPSGCGTFVSVLLVMLIVCIIFVAMVKVAIHIFNL